MIELNKITDIKASMYVIQNAQSVIESDCIPEKLRKNLMKYTDEHIIELLQAMRDECNRLIMLHKKPKNEKIKL